MAKKTKPEDDTLLDVGEVYTKTERFVDENRSNLTYGVGGLAVLILAVIGYQSFVVAPAEASAEVDAWRAENYFEMDSMSLAALGDGYAAGLEEVMADHEGTAVGQRAAYRMGIYYRDAGDFEGAIAAFLKALKLTVCASWELLLTLHQTIRLVRRSTFTSRSELWKP